MTPANGHAAPTFNWTEKDGEELLVLISMLDSDRIVAWMSEHILTYLDMRALWEFLCRMITVIYPMELTKDVNLDANEFWGLSADPDGDTNSLAAGRMVTASLNEDWDTVTALIKATLRSTPEDDHGRIAVNLITALGHGLKAITDRNHQAGTQGADPR